MALLDTDAEEATMLDTELVTGTDEDPEITELLEAGNDELDAGSVELDDTAREVLATLDVNEGTPLDMELLVAGIVADDSVDAGPLEEVEVDVLLLANDGDGATVPELLPRKEDDVMKTAEEDVTPALEVAR